MKYKEDRGHCYIKKVAILQFSVIMVGEGENSGGDEFKSNIFDIL
jgi:hypothetical protein